MVMRFWKVPDSRDRPAHSREEVVMTDKHNKALKTGMELFEAQQELSEAVTALIRKTLDMDRALEGMNESQRAMVAADMVMGVKAKNDAAIAEEMAADEALERAEAEAFLSGKRH
jgi:hypothetical protein